MHQLDSMQVELELARKIFWLLKHDHIFLTSYNEDKKAWDDGAYPAINCNDLFVPAADAEILHAEEIDAYIEVVKEWDDEGSAAWVAVVRGVTPWRVYTEGENKVKFEKACIFVQDIMKKYNLKQPE